MKLYDDSNSRRGLHALIMLMHIVTVAACVLFLGHIFGSRFSMDGSSMSPQIEDEEVVLINRAVYGSATPSVSNRSCLRRKTESVRSNA